MSSRKHHDDDDDGDNVMYTPLEDDDGDRDDNHPRSGLDHDSRRDDGRRDEGHGHGAPPHGHCWNQILCRMVSLLLRAPPYQQTSLADLPDHAFVLNWKN